MAEVGDLEKDVCDVVYMISLVTDFCDSHIIIDDEDDAHSPIKIFKWEAELLFFAIYQSDKMAKELKAKYLKSVKEAADV